MRAMQRWWPEVPSTQTGILSFSVFSNVQFILTSCWFNLTSRRLNLTSHELTLISMSHQQITKVKFFTPWLVVDLGGAKEAPPPFSPSFRCSFQQKLCEILGYRPSLGNPGSATLNIVICRSVVNAKAPGQKLKDVIFGICNPSFWSGISPLSLIKQPFLRFASQMDSFYDSTGFARRPCLQQCLPYSRLETRDLFWLCVFQAGVSSEF